MQDIDRFIAGFRSFRHDYFKTDNRHFDPLKTGQSPKTMVIACSDSRVDPALLTNSEPGDLFTVRNVANLVPPNEAGDSGHHGVSAALEYAVCHLHVEHIVVMGHSGCGGIETLMQCGKSCNCGDEACENKAENDNLGFIKRWISIAAPARDLVMELLGHKDEELQRRAIEQAAVLVSLENLCSFPFVTKALEQGRLKLHGWYFDLQKGRLFEYDPEIGSFERIDRGEQQNGISTPEQAKVVSASAAGAGF